MKQHEYRLRDLIEKQADGDKESTWYDPFSWFDWNPAKKGIDEGYRQAPERINEIITEYIKKNMNTPGAYITAGGLGFLGGNIIGSQYGDALAEDLNKKRTVGKFAGGMIGGTTGAAATLAALYLLNKYNRT